MQYVDIVSSVKYPAIVIDTKSRTICDTNESFKKMCAGDWATSSPDETTPEFSRLMTERLIRNMEDLDALIMTCSIPINGEQKMVRAVCQYADYGNNEKIVAVFELENESTMLPLENYVTSQLVPAGILVMDLGPDGSAIRYANDNFYQMMGYTRVEYNRMYNRNFFEQIFKENSSYVYENIKEQISQKGQFYIDRRVKCKDGVKKWIYMRGREFKGTDGKTVFYIVVTDITESSRFWDQISLEQQSFSAIERISKDIVFKYDYRKKLINLSGALLFKLTGVFSVECSIEDLLNGKGIISFEPERVKQIIRAIRSDKHKEFPLCARNRQQDKRWLSLDYYSIRKQDETAVSAVGVISDMTEQVAARDYYDKAITLWSSKQDDCVAALAINVTNGTIISGFSKVLKNIKLDGFDAEAYAKELLKMTVDGKSRDWLKESLMPQSLIKAYREGQTHLSYEIELNDNGKLEWYRMTGLLHKNPKTDDLILLLKWRDINDTKLQQKINDLLFYKEYDFICCIFTRIDSYLIVSEAENRSLIPKSVTQGYEATVKMIVEKYGDPQDVEYARHSFSIKNLCTQLEIRPTYSFAVNGKYPDGSPTVKLNNFTYLDKGRGIILYTRKDVTNETEILSVKIENSVRYVPFQDIIYVESFGKRSFIVTQHEKYNVNEMLSGIQVRLPGRDFMRCHRCYIVRFDSIKKIEKYTVTMSNGDIISANRSSVEIIRKKLNG